MKKDTASIAISVVMLYCAAVIVTISLKPYYAGTEKGIDLIERIFGGLRSAVADWSYMKAEEYHHNGMPFMKTVAYHQGESSFSVERTESVTGGHEEGPGASHAEGYGIFAKIYPYLRLTYDSHLAAAQEKEVLPWFYLEVKFNPHDIRGYVLGGYWLSRFDKEKSLRFLLEGEKNNPDSAQINGSLGDLYFGMHKTDDALRYLERARQLWIEGKYPNKADEKYARTDRLYAFDLLADIYAGKGEYKKAAMTYGELFSLDPSPEVLRQLLAMKQKAEARKP